MPFPVETMSGSGACHTQVAVKQEGQSEGNPDPWAGVDPWKKRESSPYPKTPPQKPKGRQNPPNPGGDDDDDPSGDGDRGGRGPVPNPPGLGKDPN
eukprot:4574124-Amphidinium_carterae.1